MKGKKKLEYNEKEAKRAVEREPEYYEKYSNMAMIKIGVVAEKLPKPHELIRDYHSKIIEEDINFAERSGLVTREEADSLRKELQEIKEEKLGKSLTEVIGFKNFVQEDLIRGRLLEAKKQGDIETLKRAKENMKESQDKIVQITIETRRDKMKELSPEEKELARDFIYKTRDVKKEVGAEIKAIEDAIKSVRRKERAERRKETKKARESVLTKKKPKAVPSHEMARIVRAIESTPKVEEYLTGVMLAKRKRAEEEARKEMGKMPSKHDLIKQAMRDKSFRNSMSAEARKRGYGSVEKYVDAIARGKESKVPSVAKPLIEKIFSIKNEKEKVRQILARDEEYQAARKALETHEKALEQAKRGRLQALLKREKKKKFAKTQAEKIRRMLSARRKR